MSIVSLEKYLNGSNAQSAASAQNSSDLVYLELASRLMAGICRSVFVGEPFTDLSENLEALRKSLQVNPDQGAISQQARLGETLLQTFQDRMRLDRQQTITDFKRVLDIVNETLAQVTESSERSDDRFKQVEQGLSRATRIEDMTVLRGHLNKMLATVRNDSKSEEQHRKKLLDNLDSKIRTVHETAASLPFPLLGRPQAIEHLIAICNRQAPPDSMHAALFTIDSLRAIRIRHGEEVASRVLSGVASTEIQPLAHAGHVFIWSPSTLLLLWEHNDAEVPVTDVIQHLKTPIEHRAFVGSRTAVFNLSVRSLVARLQGTAVEMAETLDRFSSGAQA